MPNLKRKLPTEEDRESQDWIQQFFNEENYPEGNQSIEKLLICFEDLSKYVLVDALKIKT